METETNLTDSQDGATYVVITPEWENVARYFAHGLAEHVCEKGYKGAVGSFIEQIRYLEHKNPEFIDQLIKEMKDDYVE